MSLSIATVRQRLTCIQSTSWAIPDIHIEYKDLLNKIFLFAGDDTLESLTLFIENLNNIKYVTAFNDLLGVLVIRFRQNILPHDQSKKLAEFFVENVVPRTSVNVFQINNVRRYLATLYQKDNQLGDAIIQLRLIPLENDTEMLYPDDTKMEIFLHIAYLSLLCYESAVAEDYIMKASILNEKTDDEFLKIFFDACSVILLERQTKYIEAAQIYHKLCLSTVLPAEICMNILKCGLLCIILAPFSPLRNQILATFLEDSRCQCISTFPIFNNILRNRLVSPDEVDKLHLMLLPCDMTKLSHGFTRLGEAIIEHNLLVISKMHKSIKIEDLSILLNMDPNKANEMTALMITKDRLKGSIDQVDGIVQFG